MSGAVAACLCTGSLLLAPRLPALAPRRARCSAVLAEAASPFASEASLLGRVLSGSKYGFGTERRLGTSREDAASAAIPGPGAYRTTSSVGVQHSSSHQTQPAFGFGSSMPACGSAFLLPLFKSHCFLFPLST